MGQYFTPYLEAADGTKRLVGQSLIFNELKDTNPQKAFEYYEGVKLMEHSWVGNSLTNAVSSMLYNNPQKLAWIGDYSPDYEIVETEGEKLKYSYTQEEADFDVDGRFCVNHDKKEFFRFSNLPVQEEYKGVKYIIYPLSLMTARGNGNGGGDYYGRACRQLIGIWAYDTIEIKDDVPEGYEEIFPKFRER